MIDWKNKPDGAQRYNKNCYHNWLKREGDNVSYHKECSWVTYTSVEMGLGVWNRATPEPNETIDWKNKPDGAQRYNSRVANKWLKREGDDVSYHTITGWLIYGKQSVGLNAWNDATPDPRETPETRLPPALSDDWFDDRKPLQLTWNGAPAKATHILQHETSSKQVFATMIDGKLFETSDTTQGLPDGEWFIVSTFEEHCSVDSTINERGERYGKFNEGADIMQTLKNVMRKTDGWERLTASQREALEMIQHKIGRVLNGDPAYDDNWRDICGYSQLILDELNGTKR